MSTYEGSGGIFIPTTENYIFKVISEKKIGSF